VSDLAPLTRQAFRDLLDLLREVGDTHFVPERGIIEEGTAAEAYRSILHLLAAACEHHLEGDPDRPLFTRIVSPQRKLLGDNPDAIYFWTRVHGTRSYRIRGALGDAVYTSFTVHGRDPAGGSMERVIADVSDRDISIARDGSYEIVLSPQQRDGNWLRLEVDATSVITRHYFERERSAAADPSLHVDLRIDPIDDPGPPPAPTDAAVAERLRAVAAHARANTLGMPRPSQAPPIPFVSRVPNVLPRPTSFRASGVDALGAVDIFYAMAPFLLQQDEALLMEGRLPPCRFANVVLWNMHMQTLEYRFRRTSLNRRQMRLSSDGDFRIAVAHREPAAGVDWLDTEGRMLGTVFWRFVLPDTEPGEIGCRVVKLDEIGTSR
jgi:hypothetical protein